MHGSDDIEEDRDNQLRQDRDSNTGYFWIVISGTISDKRLQIV
jgi:hypothetical protein